MKLLRMLAVGCLLLALASPAAAGPFEEGRAAHQQKRYDEAIRLFTVDINSGTNTPHNLAVVYNNRGNSYLAKGQLGQALADFNRAIDLDPSHANPYYNRSIVHERQGKKTQAIADVQQYIKLKPQDPDGPSRLARLQKGVTPPVKQSGDKPATFYNDRGWQRYKAGQLAEALADFNQAIKIKPDFALAYNNRGIVHRKMKKYDLALVDYRKVLALDNDSRATAFAHFNLALLFELKGDYPSAIAHVKKFMQLDPKDQDGPRLLARLEKKAGTSTTTKVTTPPPTTPPPTTPPTPGLTAKQATAEGWQLYKQGKLDEAIAKYNQAIKLDPNYALAYHNRGMAFRKKGMYERAIADYNRVLQLKPNVAVVYYNRSLAYELLGDLQKAMADIETYIKKVPDDPDGPAAKARIQRKMSGGGQ